MLIPEYNPDKLGYTEDLTLIKVKQILNDLLEWKGDDVREYL